MKTAIITGAYGAIGKEIAIGLARAGFNTILTGRDLEQLQNMVRIVKDINPACRVSVYSLDLSSKEAIFRFAQELKQPIDVLVNNAATAPVNRTVNAEGIEMQWATNVLGYFWLIRAFENHLKEVRNGRVVNVASYWAGGLELDDPEFKQRPYHNDTAYRQSKQADRMLAYGFSAIYGGKIQINACHPGDANSKLSNDLGFGGSETARKAAQTPVFLASSPEVQNVTGAYFVNSRQASCQFQDNRREIDRLMEICGSY